MQKRKFKEERPMMSTLVTITVFSDQSTIHTNNIIDQAFGQFIDVINKFTRFKSSSELMQLNLAPKEQAQKVSPELFTLINFALQIAHKTDGMFDPTIIDLLEAYGYGQNPDFQKLDNPNLMQEIKQIVSTRKTYKAIELNPTTYEITLAKNQNIDLGGIGKGYAIDLAYNVLADAFDSFLIDAGGDLRAKGYKENDEPWLVALQNTQSSNNETFVNIKLENKALAASGSWARKIRFFHHLINPKTGLPLDEIKQTFVLANTAIEADAWATALFMIADIEKFKFMNPELEALLVNRNGDVKHSENFVGLYN